MSARLAREVDAVQNAALSAVLVWRFCVEYGKVRRTPTSTPLPALFLPLPMLFTEELASMIRATRPTSGLRQFAAKFADPEHSKVDVLLSLQRRASLFRPQTLEAIRVAVSCRLLFIDSRTGEITALSEAAPASVPESVRPLLRDAEKLGHWAGQVSLFELGAVLRFNF